nr:NifU family protein [Bacteriovoracaceae bacterium]
MLHRVEKLLDEQVRPGLAGHGGGVDIIDLDNEVLFVRLKGGCQGCSSSNATVKEGIR